MKSERPSSWKKLGKEDIPRIISRIRNPDAPGDKIKEVPDHLNDYSQVSLAKFIVLVGSGVAVGVLGYDAINLALQHISVIIH